MMGRFLQNLCRIFLVLLLATIGAGSTGAAPANWSQTELSILQQSIFAGTTDPTNAAPTDLTRALALSGKNVGATGGLITDSGIFRALDGTKVLSVSLNFSRSSNAPNRTGTVWDDITPTQDVYPGSVIPKSFELNTPSGQKVWVHGNATEHLAEYAQGQAKHYAPDVVRLHTQQQIVSMQSAVNTATSGGVKYDQLIKVDGWELKFSPPRETGQLPALIHAQPVR